MVREVNKFSSIKEVFKYFQIHNYLMSGLYLRNSVVVVERSPRDPSYPLNLYFLINGYLEHVYKSLPVLNKNQSPFQLFEFFTVKNLKESLRYSGYIVGELYIQFITKDTLKKYIILPERT